jgi:type IV pilus assembly protein PilW
VKTPFSLRGKQTGLSLIELMVALLIGVFLILGVTQIFINNQTSYLFQQSQLGNQENGRFALALLNQEVLKAGYRSNVVSFLPAGNALAGCVFPEGAAVVAVSPTSFCIQYQATSRADVSCQGAAMAAGDRALITKPYSARASENAARPVIVERIAFDPNTNSITCTSGTVVQQMVTGVSDVRFEYGYGVKGQRSLTGYSTTPPNIVVAVRYSILMQSPGNARIRENAAISPALQDWNNRYQTLYNDTVSIYQIVQGTTMIRNQMP